MNTNWQPVTAIPYDPAPSAPTDPRDRPLDFTFTLNEGSRNALYSMEAMRARREANKRDEQRRRDARAAAASRALEAEFIS